MQWDSTVFNCLIASIVAMACSSQASDAVRDDRVRGEAGVESGAGGSKTRAQPDASLATGAAPGSATGGAASTATDAVAPEFTDAGAASVCTPLVCGDGGCPKFEWPSNDCGSFQFGLGHGYSSQIIVGCGYVDILGGGPFGQFSQALYDEATGDLISRRGISLPSSPPEYCEDRRADVRAATTRYEPWQLDCPSARTCYCGTPSTGYMCHADDGGFYEWFPLDGGVAPLPFP